MEKLSDLLEMAKVSDIIATKKEKEDNKIVWALAIIGAIAAVAGIAFAVYKYLTPDYMDDFDEDFDDDFDDDFFDEEDVGRHGVERQNQARFGNRPYLLFSRRHADTCRNNIRHLSAHRRHQFPAYPARQQSRTKGT